MQIATGSSPMNGTGRLPDHCLLTSGGGVCYFLRFEQGLAWLSRLRRSAIHCERYRDIHHALTTLACSAICLRALHGRFRNACSMGAAKQIASKSMERCGHIRLSDGHTDMQPVRARDYARYHGRHIGGLHASASAIRQALPQRRARHSCRRVRLGSDH